MTKSVDAKPIIGLIGMGEMGRMYANRLALDPNQRLTVCDVPKNFEKLKAEYAHLPNVVVRRNGHFVSRESDLIIYSVEAASVDHVVAEYGPSTKIGAIVAGQTSVKAPEREAFERHLPSDVEICSIHSLHGPTVAPDGQALVRFVVIPHRCSDDSRREVERLLSPLNSRIVQLSYDEHDEVTANTQACTHAAFLSMGTAWAQSNRFPWETGKWVGGVEVAKINITLRIYSSKWHVYAGLAILNPAARKQIEQFSRSCSDIFKMMIAGDEDGLRHRIFAARDGVFGKPGSPRGGPPVFLSDDVFSRFAIGDPGAAPGPPNSHLTLLAIVDCWHTLGLKPFHHLELAATPIFRMWFGVIEYLFRSEDRLDRCIKAAVHDLSYRSDDCEFVVAARGWSQCVGYGDFKLYERRFEETAKFFGPMFEEGKGKGNAMLKYILEERGPEHVRQWSKAAGEETPVGQQKADA